MKRAGLVLAAAVLAIYLVAGCAHPHKGQDESAGTEEAAEGLQGELVLLHYLDGAKLELWERFIQEFTAMHPGVTVDSSGTDYASFLTLLRNRAAAGNLPDFWQASPAMVTDLIEAEMVMDLNGAGIIRQLPLKGDIYAECMWGGGEEIWGAPYSLKVYALYYNQDIFERYGLKAPSTHSEFLYICETLSENGIDPFIRANGDYNSLYADLRCELVPRLMAGGHSDYYGQLMAGEMGFSDYEEFRISVDNLLVRYQWGREDDMTNDAQAAAERFSAGEAAMYVGILTTMIETLNMDPGFNLHCVPFPFTDYQVINHKMVVELDDGWMINADAGSPELAAEWLKYLYEGEQAQRWMDRVGLLMVQSGLDSSGQKPYLKELELIHRSGKTVQNCIPQPVGDFMGRWRACLQEWAAQPEKTTNMLIEEGQAIFDDIIAHQD